MATVYLAQDLKLDRQVAVKVLRPELAAAIGSERFLREIKLTARLEHPHILTLHDSGEADGFLYYVMPYVAGESLRDRLNREKQLPIDDAIRITREVADALDFAHQHDVVHRDIKPENILLAAGHARVADFGIARAISAAGGDRLTETGLAVGTPAYMSPEQATGDEVDTRSDVYSLGCVVYEMLAGQAPFLGPTVESVVQQHLTAEPPSVSAMRATVPVELSATVQKGLQKAPADRFSKATQFAEALTTAQTAPRAVQTHSARVPAAVERGKPRRNVIAYVAMAVLAIIGAYTVISRTVGPPESATAAETPKLVVLPFNNLGSAEDDYFADGISEEITSRIAEISGLRVISRQSAVQYNGSDKTLQQIGEELSVEYVVEGTIRTDRAPDGSGQVRVTPQLIRVSDDAHLWTDRYTANLVPGEIFGVQEQIANQVAQALDVTLLEPERQHLAARPTDNQEAYDYYLRGIAYRRRSTNEDDTRIAIELFKRAAELDPNFAAAYAALSFAHAIMWWFFYDRSPERLAAAKAAADETLRLNPEVGHEAMGWYYYMGQQDYDRAIAEFEIVKQSQPNNAAVALAMGGIERRQGNINQALAHHLNYLELAPGYADAELQLALTYILLRDPDEAAKHLDEAIALTPDVPRFYFYRASWVSLGLEGSASGARAVLERAESVGLAKDPWIVYAWVLLEMYEAHYQEALDRLDLVSSQVLFESQLRFASQAQVAAQLYGLLGNEPREVFLYDSARIMLEARIQERPDDERYRSALGIAYAGLGRNQDAIREAELGVELAIGRDAWKGAQRVEDLARVYTMVGEHDAAIDQLEHLLTVPSNITVPMLRMDPIWDPLRSHPRFQELLAKYEN
jgi:serine/threonine-protein kinase